MALFQGAEELAQQRQDAWRLGSEVSTHTSWRHIDSSLTNEFVQGYPHRLKLYMEYIASLCMCQSALESFCQSENHL